MGLAQNSVQPDLSFCRHHVFSNAPQVMTRRPAEQDYAPNDGPAKPQREFGRLRRGQSSVRFPFAKKYFTL